MIHAIACTVCRKSARLLGSRRAAALTTGLLLAGPAGVHAQSWQAQGAWVSHHVAGALLGIEGRQLLGSPPPLPGMGGGPVVAGTRDWMLTGMLGAGVNLNPAGSASVAPIFYGHLGVLYRTGSDVLSRVGVVGAGFMRARAFGPEVLLELEGVVDVQAGALHTPGGWKPGVSVGVAVRFLGDIFG